MANTLKFKMLPPRQAALRTIWDIPTSKSTRSTRLAKTKRPMAIQPKEGLTASKNSLEVPHFFWHENGHTPVNKG